MITNIYFDWGNTLGKPKHKDIFIYGSNKKTRLSALYPDSLETLKYLKKKGYKIGIISNSSKTTNQIIEGLLKNDMLDLFEGAIIATNGKNICKKGCTEVFHKALLTDQVFPQNAVMIGNNYKKDIIGARNVGMHTIYIKRPNMLPGGLECARIKNIEELKCLL